MSKVTVVAIILLSLVSLNGCTWPFVGKSALLDKRVSELENTVSAKDKEIEKLQAAVKEKDLKIEEMRKKLSSVGVF